MIRPLAALLLLLAACDGPAQDSAAPEPDDPSPLLVLSSGLVDFGTVDLADAPLYELVSLKNEGDATLYLGDLSLDDPDTPFGLEFLGDPVLEPYQWASLEIELRAEALGELRTTANIESNDPFGTRGIILRADARGGELSLDPPAEDLGTLSVGCPASTELRVYNSGNADLLITEVDLEQVGQTFTLEATELPFTLVPTEYRDLQLDYTPVEEGSDTVIITVTSDDPIEPARSATISAGATIDTWTEESFDVPIHGRMDMIIAVDKSGSMQDWLTRLLTAFGGFHQILDQAGIDFQIAVTQADDGCINGSNIWIDNGFTESEAESTIETMVNLGGSYASNTERAFMLLEAALAETPTGGCNEGLLREDASLHLMGISDEAEQSVNSWSYYLGLFQAYNPGVTLHAIGGPVPEGCTGAAAYDGMYEATQATGGGFYSICDKDWSGNLEELASLHLSGLRTFRLEDPAIDATISVQIDAISTDAWRYEEDWQSVVLDDSVNMLGGEEVEIRYAAKPACGS